MAERNHALYASLSHRELYDQLMAGQPHQIEGHAATLKSMHDTVDHLTHTLTTDLQELGRSWQSSSGQEYTRRLGAITTYSGQLATDFHNLQSALGVMAGDLRSAQSQAESPDKADNNNNMIEDAVIGTAIAGPAGGLIGGWLGHNQDDQARQQAHDRMANQVATLASKYEMRQGQWPQPPAPPHALPGGSGGGHVNAVAAGGGAHASGYSGLDGAGTPDHQQLAAPGHTSAGPTLGQPGTPATTPSGTSLLADGGLALTATGLTGLGINGLRGGPVPSVSGTGLDGSPGRGPAGNGVIGPDDDPALRNGTQVAGARNGTGTPGETEEELAARANRSGLGSANSAANRSAMLGRGGHGEGDEPDEHLTWLTEDEMVWGADSSSGPAVLGVDSTATPPE